MKILIQSILGVSFILMSLLVHAAQPAVAVMVTPEINQSSKDISPQAAAAIIRTLQMQRARVFLCDKCYASPGTWKRNGCNHMFCNNCHSGAVDSECPGCLEDANACAICLSGNEVGTIRTLLCGHKFCNGCVQNWEATQVASADQVVQPTCPTCRDPLIYKNLVSCDLCRLAFKDHDEVTPPMVCRFMEKGWGVKMRCRKIFIHRFHDKCFYSHYLSNGQHRTDTQEHVAICPVHKKTEVCDAHPRGCMHDSHPFGSIPLSVTFKEKNGSHKFVEYEPTKPDSRPVSPRTAAEMTQNVHNREFNQRMTGVFGQMKIPPPAPGEPECTIL